MTIVLAKLTAIAVIKNHSQGIHEVEWHQCDLRKELCAYGGIGSPIPRKIDLFRCVLASLYEALSVRPLVGWSVGWSVRHAFVKIDEKWPFTDSK